MNSKRIPQFCRVLSLLHSEHSNPTCRRLHFVGTSLVIAMLAYTIGSGKWLLLLAVPLAGYGFAWVGHFFFERTARPPSPSLYSLIGDFVMFRDILLGRSASE
jgi:hypothetical protein